LVATHVHYRSIGCVKQAIICDERATLFCVISSFHA
jgi:hypothetical protein